jgi:hypothetical protein
MAGRGSDIYVNGMKSEERAKAGTAGLNLKIFFITTLPCRLKSIRVDASFCKTIQYLLKFIDTPINAS